MKSYTVRVRPGGYIEIKVMAADAGEAKRSALAVARAFVDTLDGDDEGLVDWKVSAPNTDGIEVREDDPPLCGGPISLVRTREGMVPQCERCDHRPRGGVSGSTCRRPVRPVGPRGLKKR